MNPNSIESELSELLKRRLADIRITVEASGQNGAGPTVTFVSSAFAGLYVSQRYHLLIHAIPALFVEKNLREFKWFELAPGESPEDLVYPDDESICEITDDVMDSLEGRNFFGALDDALYPSDLEMPARLCHGNFANAEAILIAKGFKESEHFDIFHVLMARGGYCDCEILYNAVETSRLKADYWKAQAAGGKAYDPHRGRG